MDGPASAARQVAQLGDLAVHVVNGTRYHGGPLDPSVLRIAGSGLGRRRHGKIGHALSFVALLRLADTMETTHVLVLEDGALLETSLPTPLAHLDDVVARTFGIYSTHTTPIATCQWMGLG